MTQEYYYIISGKNRNGPYDLIALVRKIRNGSLTSGVQLQLGELTTPKAAQEWPELAEFFGEKKEDQPAHEREAAHQRTLSSTLRSGWHFLQNNQYSTLFSGVYVLLIIMIAALVTAVTPLAVRPVAFMLCFVLAYFMLSCYMLIVLRLGRGQPVDVAYLKSKIGPMSRSLLLSSLLISFPAFIGVGLVTSQLPVAVLAVGLFIFAVPGLYMLALYSFAPLLILDRGFDFWDAMETSRKTVMKRGMETAGIIYALYVINFLAGLCVLLPLTITLPITMGALSEMFDELFS